MSTQTRNLSNIDGVSVPAPTQTGFISNRFEPYANDAAFEVDHPTPVAGSVYYNTTEKCLREYSGTQWQYDKLMLSTYDNSTLTGADQDLTPDAFNQVIHFSNESLTSIRSIDPALQKLLYLVNGQASQAITIINEDGTATAANRIVTGTELDFTLEPGQAVSLVYDFIGQRWRLSGAASSAGAGDPALLVNYFDDPGFENSADAALPDGWVQYDDGASSVPVDGTGGAAVGNVTFLVTSSSPIRGQKSAIISKGAGDEQGVGYSYPFTIALSDRGMFADVSFEILTSANYVSGDLGVFLYDVTNAAIVTPRFTGVPKSDSYGKFFSSYRLTTGTSYRFILHITSTNASAWTATIDSMVNTTVDTGDPIVTNTGEKNYCSNPSALFNTAGWAISGAGTLARITTAANLPREFTTGSAIQFTSSTDEEYVRFRFSLDDVDIGWRLKWILDYIAASANFRLEMWKNSASDYSGSYTEVSLEHDVSGDSYLVAAATSAHYGTTFDTDSTIYRELRIVHNGTNSDTIYFSDVLVGSGTIGQVSPSSYLGTYTPVLTSSGATNLGLNSGFNTLDIWREADRLIIKGTIKKDAVALGGTTSNPLFLGLPSGLTAKAQVADYKLGTYSRFVTAYEDEQAVVYTSSGIAFISPTTTGYRTAANFPANTAIYIDISVPIAEWAGSGLSTSPGSEPEFAYNSSGITAAGAADTTSFAYGPAGAAIGNIASTTGANSTTNMRVRFQYPVQTSDKVELEVDMGSSGARWVSFGAALSESLFQGTSVYGAYIRQVNSTDFDVSFGNKGVYSSNATYAGDGTAWSGVSGWRWRVRKYRNGQLPFAKATATNSGLYKAGEAPGQVSGATIAAGNIGETISASVLVATNNSTSPTTFTNDLTLTAGVWRIVYFDTTYRSTIPTAGNSTQASARIQNITDGTTTAQVAFYQYLTNIASDYEGAFNGAFHMQAVVNISSTKVYRGQGTLSVSNGAVTSRGSGSFFAVRIA